MTTSPNLDLLQRQRTFSIDETREQLQQGRPVQRLAVTSGEVDYGTMMYGDGYQVPTATAVENSKMEESQPKAAAPKAPAGSWAALVKNTNVSGNSNDNSAMKPVVKQHVEPAKKISDGSSSPVKKPVTSKQNDSSISSHPLKESSRPVKTVQDVSTSIVTNEAAVEVVVAPVVSTEVSNCEVSSSVC